jgi:hypothetical protein
MGGAESSRLWGEKKGCHAKLLQGSLTMDSEGRVAEGVHGRGLGFPALEESLLVSREGGHARRGEGEAGARVQGAEEQGARARRRIGRAPCHGWPRGGAPARLRKKKRERVHIS